MAKRKQSIDIDSMFKNLSEDALRDKTKNINEFNTQQFDISAKELAVMVFGEQDSTRFIELYEDSLNEKFELNISTKTKLKGKQILNYASGSFLSPMLGLCDGHQGVSVRTVDFEDVGISFEIKTFLVTEHIEVSNVIINCDAQVIHVGFSNLLESWTGEFKIPLTECFNGIFKKDYCIDADLPMIAKALLTIPSMNKAHQ